MVGIDLTPCIVVVDSRNIRGQSRKVFGHSRETHVPGLRRGLAMYGFDVIETIFGLATRTSTNHPSDRLQKALASNARYAARLTQDGAQVLEGNLVQRGGELEEKQVDVLCALAVADASDRIAKGETHARCVVVLSEDMDLMPAFDFATTRKVKAYAAAYDTVYHRPQQRDWLVLHEHAMKEICDPPGRFYGTALRAKLAAMLTSQNPSKLNWRVTTPAMNDGRAILTNNAGANGLWVPDRTLARGDRVELFAVDVEMDPHGKRFPFVLLETTAPAAPPAAVEAAEVLYWSSPTMLKARLASGVGASLRAVPGSLLPGDKITVFSTRRAGNRAHYLVGATHLNAPPSGWSATTRQAVAVITTAPQRGRAWMEATLEETGDSVAVKASWNDHLEDGGRMVVALTGADQAGIPQAMPLSCCIA